MEIVTLFYKRITLHVPPINMWEKCKVNNERERVKKRMRESEKLIVFFFFLIAKGISGNFEK